MDSMPQIYNPLHGLVPKEQEGVSFGALQAMQGRCPLQEALTRVQKDLYGD